MHLIWKRIYPSSGAPRRLQQLRNQNEKNHNTDTQTEMKLKDEQFKTIPITRGEGRGGRLYFGKRFVLSI